MKRTTIYLEPELEIGLKLQAKRESRPMAEIIREALRGYLETRESRLPPGAGQFSSGHSDTAEKAEELLAQLKFGEDS